MVYLVYGIGMTMIAIYGLTHDGEYQTIGIFIALHSLFSMIQKKD